MTVRWCILRCQGRRTLPLAETLAADGFEVWTPVETRRVRSPRLNARRHVRLPIMAGFVFANGDRLADLIDLERIRPGFSLFRYFDRIPLVDDAALEPLRTEERKVVPAQHRQTFGRGERVRVPTGCFAGMAGVVEQGDGRFTIVDFGSGVTVKISTFILQPFDSINRAQAALAA